MPEKTPEQKKIRDVEDDRYIEEMNYRGKVHMVIGGASFGIGVAILLASVVSVATGGGGVLPWGLLIFGAIEFFNGLRVSGRL